MFLPENKYVHFISEKYLWTFNFIIKNRKNTPGFSMDLKYILALVCLARPIVDKDFHVLLKIHSQFLLGLLILFEFQLLLFIFVFIFQCLCFHSNRTKMRWNALFYYFTYNILSLLSLKLFRSKLVQDIDFILNSNFASFELSFSWNRRHEKERFQSDFYFLK